MQPSRISHLTIIIIYIELSDSKNALSEALDDWITHARQNKKFCTQKNAYTLLLDFVTLLHFSSFTTIVQRGSFLGCTVELCFFSVFITQNTSTCNPNFNQSTVYCSIAAKYMTSDFTYCRKNLMVYFGEFTILITRSIIPLDHPAKK
jgi:hypothetical protein